MKGSARANIKGGGDISKKISIPVVEPDRFIYPVITIKDNNASFQVQNNSTGDPLMKLTGISSISKMTIDCKNCIIRDDDKNKVLSFSEVGWTKVSDIVWLRLRNGVNDLEMKGSGNVTITYEMPYKKVGGWFE